MGRAGTSVGVSLALVVGTFAGPLTYAFGSVGTERAALTSDRIAGVDRYATAAAISGAAFAAGAPAVVLASGETFADALAGGPVAAALGGPLLLTARATLPTATSAELVRLSPARVLLLGGPTTISDGVLAAVRTALPAANVERVAGLDRYTTAVLASQLAFGSGVASVYLVTGTQFPDGLSASAAASTDHSPILLTPTNTLTPEITAEIQRLAPKRIVLLGGPKSVGPAVEAAARALTPAVVRASGVDRYGTSAAVAQVLFARALLPDGTPAPLPTHAYVASGVSFADALAGGAVAGATGSPLLLVPAGCIPATTRGQINAIGITTITVLGGPTSVSDAVAAGTDCPVPDWLTEVNGYRAAYGAPPVIDDAQAGGDVAAHIFYELATSQFGHTEDPSSPYYTASGNTGGGTSDLSFGISATSAIDFWMAAPFHALSLLAPRATGEAFAADGYAGLAIAYRASQPAPQWPLHWPSTGVPVHLLTGSSETPNPTSGCPADYQTRLTGLPLLASFGFAAAPVTAATASLTSGGKALAVCVVTESNYTYPDPAWQRTAVSILAANHSILLIARDALRPSTTYQVAVQTNDGDLAWSFTTTANAI